MRFALFLFALAAAAQTVTYRDPKARFEFTYPASFGQTSPGTDDGFEDRLAAIRFSGFSAGLHDGRIVLGGEAALTRGFPLLDIQAAGGLYDSITLGAFPAPMRAAVVKTLPSLTAANLCDALARDRHAPTGSSAPILQADSMRNIDPKVMSCRVSGDTVTFDKEVSFMAGSPRQRVYGAVRFLRPPYSTFQLIRATAAAPTAAILKEMTDLVNSWTPRSN